MEYPRVLIFSNNCFSKTDSNGRTLLNFFKGWPKEKIAQFYVQNAEPDFSYCSRYYRVTDKEALKSFYSSKKGGIITATDDDKIRVEVASCNKNIHSNRNSITMLLRDVIWNMGCWKTKEYEDWIRDIKPEIVLLQAGDCAFMFKLAMSTAKKTGAKFVIYNTEGYYFKQFDYFRSRGIAHLMYAVFRCNLMKIIKKAYNMVDLAIFNCDALRDDFCKEFHMKSGVVYTATDVSDSKKTKGSCSEFITSYAGNLGVGRPESLIDVANVLKSIDDSLYLDIYGTIPNSEVEQLFNNCPGIRFHGRVSYEEVKRVMQNSDLLIHVESFDSFYREDSKYAFSTKIADCLASNTCFLMYAPNEFAATKYLLHNRAAYVASCYDELKVALQEIVSDSQLRNKYCSNAVKISKQNHDMDASVYKFQKLLCNLCGNQ